MLSNLAELGGATVSFSKNCEAALGFLSELEFADQRRRNEGLVADLWSTHSIERSSTSLHALSAILLLSECMKGGERSLTNDQYSGVARMFM
jgi:hypothetical protein